MDEALKEARTSLVRQIKEKPGVTGTRAHTIIADELSDQKRWKLDPAAYASLLPPISPNEHQAKLMDQAAAVANLIGEYEEFKAWLYRMIASAQDDTSPAFVYSATKMRFQTLREAVKRVIDAQALALVRHDTKERLVQFQQWVDGVKPERSWQVTGKGLLVDIARVIDPYAT